MIRDIKYHNAELPVLQVEVRLLGSINNFEPNNIKTSMTNSEHLVSKIWKTKSCLKQIKSNKTNEPLTKSVLCQTFIPFYTLYSLIPTALLTHGQSWLEDKVLICMSTWSRSPSARSWASPMFNCNTILSLGPYCFVIYRISIVCRVGGWVMMLYIKGKQVQ